MAASDKTLRENARRLLHLSLGEDRRPSAERVDAVLEALRRHPPQRHRALLRMYLRLLRREIGKYQAVVEVAGSLSDASLRQLETDLSSQYGYTVTSTVRPNPQLIAGLRVRLADDVYDASALGRLSRLAAATP